MERGRLSEDGSFCSELYFLLLAAEIKAILIVGPQLPWSCRSRPWEWAGASATIRCGSADTTAVFAAFTASLWQTLDAPNQHYALATKAA